MKNGIRTLLRAASFAACALLLSSGAVAQTISAGGGFAGAIDSSGVLRTWGRNDSGQLGHSPGVSPSPMPKPVAGTWSAVAMGGDFTVAVDSTGALWSWGGNASGQLGTGGVIPSTAPLRVPLPVGAIVRAVAAGQGHGVALVDVGSDVGRVYVWGQNGSGQLGAGDTVARSTPVLLGASKSWEARRYRAIAAADAATFAIATDGSLWAWGSDISGEVGQGGSVATAPYTYSQPTQVGSLTGWTKLAAGAGHVLALRGTELYTWGRNDFGQLGNGSSGVASATPTRIGADLSWADVGSGDVHSLAVTASGALYGWGFNQTGALALAVSQTDSNSKTTPQLIGAANAPWSGAVGGFDFTVARTAAGVIYTVGANDYGQLGNARVETGFQFSPSFAVANVAAVNLTATAPSVPVTTFGVNTVLQPVSVVVQNTGQSTLTSAFTVSVYLSDDATLDAGDRLLTSSTQAAPLAALATRTVTFTTPNVPIPDVPPGGRFLISQVTSPAVTDPYEPDNGSAIAVTLTGPDLILENVAAANTSTSNASGSFAGVTVSLRNANFGAVASGRVVKVEAFLSTDDAFSAGIDVPLGQITYTAGLAAGSSLTLPATGAWNVPVPDGIAGGNYFLVLVVNRDATVSETGNGSNVASLPVSIASRDLAVTSPDFPTLATLPSGTVRSLGVNTTVASVSTYLQNQGSNAYTASYELQLLLSSDETYDPSDRVVATRSGTGLAALTSQLLTWNNVVIPDVAPGGYYLISRVVLAAGESDRNLANNAAATPINLVGATLNLTDFTFPNSRSVTAGGSFGNVTYKLANTGAGIVPSGREVLIEVFLSANGTLERNEDVLLDQYSYTGGINVNGLVSLPVGTRSINSPLNARNGIYQLLFVVNGNQAVAGAPVAIANEQVALGALDVSVSPPSSQSPTSVGVNTVIQTLTVTVNNLGGFDVPAGLKVNLYLSPDNKVDLADIKLGTATLDSAVSRSSPRSVAFTSVAVPDVEQGSYFLLFEVLLPGDLIDIDGSNNVTNVPLTVQRPNLSIASVTAQNTLNLDVVAPSFSGVTFTIENNSLGVIPAGVAVTYDIYLSRDAAFSETSDILLKSGDFSSGIAGGTTVQVPAFSVPIDSGTVGGNYYLIFVVNRLGTVKESDATPATSSRLVFLQKVNAPGLALDYGRFDLGAWSSVTDARASGSEAFQSPILAQGQQTSLSLRVTGPTTIKAPWLINAGTADTVSYAIDGVVGGSLTFFQPVYQPTDVNVPAGDHLVTWTYTQNSSATGAYARVDLDLPSFITNGDGSWVGVTDATAKVGGNFARSPQLSPGQQASMQLNVTGPAVVSFWWRVEGGVADQDKLSFFIDGDLASLPTSTFFTEASPATISGTTAWKRVAFLVEGGPRQLSWVYSQGSTTATARAYLDGLEVSSPVPATNTVNATTDPTTHAAVPVSNLDLSITSVVAPTGTYLLDDAAGTGRLPVTITIKSVGSDFNVSPDLFNPTNLKIHLSRNRVYGDVDDIVLGSFARMEVLKNGNQIVYDAELNLPFDTPSGDYYLLLRFDGASDTAEFTYANNTRVLGSGYIIRRAPDIRVTGFAGLSPRYPYHPEDPVYISYQVVNTGLGTVLPSQNFKTQVELMSVAANAETTDNAVVVKVFTPVSHSLFLPEAGGQYPNGGSSTVTQFLDLPALRDLMVKVGLVPAGTPEDATVIYVKAPLLANFRFFFRITADVDNSVQESSETNLFVFSDERFYISPVPEQLNIAQSIGNSAFETTFVNSAALDGTTIVDPAFRAIVQDYALAQGSVGTPGLLHDSLNENGVANVSLLPGSSAKFLSLTFDFNTRANDVEIDIQATSDLNQPWQTVLTLRPPYQGTFGARSLSGFGGLKDSPYVLAIEGNNTDVQQVYSARITVRDNQQLGVSPARFMRLSIRTLVPVPDLPTDLQGGYDPSITKVVLSWTGSLPTIDDPLNPGTKIASGAFVIERALAGGAFKVVGSSTTNSFSETVKGPANYAYRIRAITSGGSTAYAPQIIVGVP